MSTRTEYAVQYTGLAFGRVQRLFEELADATDRRAAERLLAMKLNWQKQHGPKLGITPDAVITTRTVTASDWETEGTQLTVQDLIDRLNKCDPEGIVAVAVAVSGHGNREITGLQDLGGLYILLDSQPERL